MTGNTARSFQYNAQGNLVAASGWLGDRTRGYDGFARVASSTAGGVGTAYVVNALDQRMRKSGPLGTFRYVYSGQNALLAQHEASGWRSFVYLGGQPIAMVASSNARYFIHTDRLTWPQLATDQNRQAVWRASNRAHHREVLLNSIGTGIRPELVTNTSRQAVWKGSRGTYSTGVVLNNIGTGIPMGFPGQVWDEETQTWHNGFRDYDPYTGRYTQSDPIGLGGGVNTYAYVGGNPISYIDPLGLFCISKKQRDAATGAVGGAISAGAGGKSPWAAAGGAIVGGVAGYNGAPAASGAVVGALSGGLSGARGFAWRGALIGGGIGAATEVEGSALAGAAGGAYEGVLNAPKTYHRTGWDSTIGPGVKGGVIGFVASVASGFTGDVVDAINSTWGDCACEE